MANNQDLVTLFIDRLADALASRLGGGPTPATASGKRRGAPRGRKLDMSCRYPKCKNRSRGPRFQFLCAEHSKLPAKEKAAITAAWKAKAA